MIHYYRDGARLAPDKALGVFARREADYYARLNDDEDYLVTDASNQLVTELTRVRRLAARGYQCSILAALALSYIDPTIGGLGWALASSSLFAGSLRWLLAKSGEPLDTSSCGISTGPGSQKRVKPTRFYPLLQAKA